MGIEGWGSKQTKKERLQATPTRYYPVKRALLQNKMDELSALTKYEGDYRRCSLFCFTETWLTEDVSDMNLPGYTTICLDRP